MLDITCLEFPCVADVSLFHSAVSAFRSFIQGLLLLVLGQLRLSFFFIFNFD